jgi:hypothetical protein
MSVPIGCVGHLGLGAACIVAVRWIRGAASNREEEGTTIQNRKQLLLLLLPQTSLSVLSQFSSAISIFSSYSSLIHVIQYS